MENKSIHDAYQEIKQREISELKEIVTKNGGEVFFDTDCAPIVMANFNGWAPHPADVLITHVKIKDDQILIDGKEKGICGWGEWDEDESPIYIDDIAYGHISYITDEIRAGNNLPTWDKETMRMSDGSWCDIDTDNGMWEYQSDADDEDTYVSGNFITDDDNDSLVIDYDGIYELPKGVKAALLACGYSLDL